MVLSKNRKLKYKNEVIRIIKRQTKYFENKVAIITGGITGIGKSICDYFAQHGSKVVIVDQNLGMAQELFRIMRIPVLPAFI